VISEITLSAIENGDFFPREARDEDARLAFDLVYSRFGDEAFDALTGALPAAWAAQVAIGAR
jgi:hypothetical protein